MTTTTDRLPKKLITERVENIYAPSEINMWEENRQFSTPNAPKLRILTEFNRERLPAFVETLKKDNYLKIQPFYQRRKRWTNKDKSLLIESFIINIPIPPVIFYEKSYSSYEVIDGQQRINAIQEFYSNKFKLTGLDLWKDLNGYTYESLPSDIRSEIDRRSIPIIVVITESAKREEDKFYLTQLAFERLNRGGIDMKPQEIRNCLYHGKFSELLSDLAKNTIFRKAWDLPLDETKLEKNIMYKKMEDIELILRFFALRHLDDFNGDIKRFLDSYMLKALNFNRDDINYLETVFNQTIELCFSIYEENLFKPFDIKNNDWGKKSHKVYYDAIMVAFSFNLDKANIILNKKELIIQKTKEIFYGEKSKLLSSGKTSKSETQERIKIVNDMLIGIVKN
ncbi:DUF262 domain-containing protein [Cyanobacterium aponinum AL20118]|uniref:DUF262 domain-containing protein n=1 Tax=Cyanobacterium aponinum AL20115 TaxID=3090662 RepID=A0AAF0ZEQ7_9CHRO|nr:DUF262 domain-containing protein [Cyanobacterium aponinum]WPF88767.1 DUF262 domain-containing protein [Cyanobacterium aponinum AL20115]